MCCGSWPRSFTSLPSSVSPFPPLPCPTPNHSVWFLILGCSLPQPTPALPVCFSPFLSLAGWRPLGLAREIWKAPTAHLPYLLVMGGADIPAPGFCPLRPSRTGCDTSLPSPSPSSWARNTLHNLPRGRISGHDHLGSGRLQSRKAQALE